jgi:hypothetical protein
MTIEILLLALASTIRPTSLAAVTAIMSVDSRRRLMFAYVVGGVAFSLAVGVLVVGAFHGVHLHSGTSRTKAIADIACGLVLFVFGGAILTGRFHRRQGHDAPAVHESWTARIGLSRRLTVPTAALAGPLTHIPGLFYLLALNVIVAHNPRAPGAVLAVVVYDIVWFALPIVALAICVVRPDAARGAVEVAQEWTTRHSRVLLLLTSFLVGIALVIRGVLEL